MSSSESRLKTDFMTLARTSNMREGRQSPTNGKDVARDSEQYQEREDLEKALSESKKSEAHLRRFIDTIPTLAWCNLPDCSNEFLLRRDPYSRAIVELRVRPRE
jgi:hypothetical protein